ncbi:zinc finger C2HC domain-containing protein 1B isoform X2 [Macrotis lagotis]|uniref:zinc finger C2HC domain-containing protein 1B isoform X2 n=1 Tax=Macrotis lagotis TaxID=92651 RepID=UPI003D693022
MNCNIIVEEAKKIKCRCGKERSGMGEVQSAAETKERHRPICKRIFNKKRKPFNSLKQRLQGTDIVTVRKFPPAKVPQKKSNWRQQHEDFINTIRSAKLCTLAIKEGRPLPPPPPPTINPDYIQCPYCKRRFNENAAARHINFCKDQTSRRVFNPTQIAARIASKSQSKTQMVPKKEPTLTSAVEMLLQNKVMELSSECTTKAGDEKQGHPQRQKLDQKALKKKLSPLSKTDLYRKSPAFQNFQ